MKDFIEIFWRVALVLAIILVCLFLLSFPRGTRQVEDKEVVHDTVYVARSVDEWEAFVNALIQIESCGNDSAINHSTNAVGCLQLTPVCVHEVNRIIGTEVFDLDDRYDRARSIAMFDIYQNYYNPGHDVHWALKLWNPRSSIQYHLDVMRKMHEM